MKQSNRQLLGRSTAALLCFDGRPSRDFRCPRHLPLPLLASRLLQLGDARSVVPPLQADRRTDLRSHDCRTTIQRRYCCCTTRARPLPSCGARPNSQCSTSPPLTPSSSSGPPPLSSSRSFARRACLLALTTCHALLRPPPLARALGSILSCYHRPLYEAPIL